ncbi:hypothetical protein C6V83_08415 [Gordonia iterans]|uniref:HTH luxR-type domain-containing protein n=1 Tax=Gordonia iterans TaxID=1004901 RepID=A0A2S0KF14_9ACTN|nr:LuxR C-terminal-related transcriptional regulator [Gordonia iterans]AVM00290.1 hypothetical protein C6V83_08415 [Gordonia iterans]
MADNPKVVAWRYRRTAEFDAVTSAWEAGRPILLTGAPGLGKTTLARQFAGTLGRTPFWIIGTPAMADTPLGAVSAAVHIDAGDDVGAIVEKLRARLAGGAVLVVEAAEHLDSTSAAVVGRVFTSIAGAGFVTTQTAVDPALRTVLDAAGIVEVTLAPLDLRAMTELVEERLCGPLAVADTVRIHRVCGGNPFYLIEYVDGALRAGDLVSGADRVWRLRRPAGVSDELRRVGVERLASADPAELRLLDLLSLCEPLPRVVVDRLGLTEGIGAAEGELVLPLDDFVVPGQAMFTEIRRAQLGELQRRGLVVDLVDALGEVATPVAGLHRARLCLEYGISLDAAPFTEASSTAYFLGDLPLAARLAEEAVDRGAGLPALLQLSRAKSGIGQASEALAVLDGVEPDSLREADLAGYAITVAINHTAGDGDHAAAVAVLDKFEPRVESTELRSAFAALRGLALIHSGAQYGALRCARTAQKTAGTSLWTSVGRHVEAEVLRRSGEVRRPLALVRRSVAQQPGSSLAEVGAQRTLVQALLSDGDLAAARRAAEALLETTLLQHIPSAVACSTAALVEAAGGSFAAARRYCESALDSLGNGDRTGLGRGTAMHLAVVCAVAGDVDGARRAASWCEQVSPAVDGWPGINPRLARAAVQVAHGEVTRPCATLRSVAAVCVTADEHYDALTVLHWAVRFGDRKAIAEFLAVAGACEGRLVRLQERHARGLRARDADELVRVSEAFADLGYLPFASDTLAQAITTVRDDENLRPARREEAVALLTNRLSELREQCERFLTPAVRDAELPVALTPRELEVLCLMSSGHSRAESAELLGVALASVSSVRSRLREKLLARVADRRSHE